jgi:hypothetical protein
MVWHDQDAASARKTLDAWCRGVGPVVHQSGPLNPTADSPSVQGPIVVASWNVNVGAGDLAPFVADLRAGQLSGGRRVEHFVLLLQEVLRTGDTVPPGGPAQSGARRIMRTPPRVDIVDFARESGLSLLYIPSMRNGLDASAPAEDRGNAILSTMPLHAPMALELPFVRQRRVAVFATLGGWGDEGPIGAAPTGSGCSAQAAPAAARRAPSQPRSRRTVRLSSGVTSMPGSVPTSLRCGRWPASAASQHRQSTARTPAVRFWTTSSSGHLHPGEP